MVHADDINIWDPNESILAKKFQRLVRECENLGLSVILDKCVIMKMSEDGEHGKDKI
jgi:hypothetical protein